MVGSATGVSSRAAAYGGLWQDFLEESRRRLSARRVAAQARPPAHQTQFTPAAGGHPEAQAEEQRAVTEEGVTMEEAASEASEVQEVATPSASDCDSRCSSSSCDEDSNVDSSSETDEEGEEAGDQLSINHDSNSSK